MSSMPLPVAPERCVVLAQTPAQHVRAGLLMLRVRLAADDLPEGGPAPDVRGVEARAEVDRALERSPVMREGVSVQEATHVQVTTGGPYLKIVRKHGISAEGRLAKPSEGGFSVTTSDGQTVSMWDAKGYGKDE